MEVKIIDIKSVETEESGSLSFFETSRDIPFEVKRVYYIYNVPRGVWRGGHAHKKLKQLLICPHGSIDIVLDDGRERRTVTLESPSKGLIVEEFQWREMLWNVDDSVLVVAASEWYDEDDYIRDYDVFLNWVVQD